MAFHYIVKFICGKEQHTDTQVVASGMYYTAINVHSSVDAKIQKRISIALPSEKPGPVSKSFAASLKASEAFEIDNQDIYSHTNNTTPTFLKGFVEMVCDTRLDVVAVYTVEGLSKPNELTALHIERIPPQDA